MGKTPRNRPFFERALRRFLRSRGIQFSLSRPCITLSQPRHTSLQSRRPGKRFARAGPDWNQVKSLWSNDLRPRANRGLLWAPKCRSGPLQFAPGDRGFHCSRGNACSRRRLHRENDWRRPNARCARQTSTISLIVHVMVRRAGCRGEEAGQLVRARPMTGRRASQAFRGAQIGSFGAGADHDHRRARQLRGQPTPNGASCGLANAPVAELMPAAAARAARGGDGISAITLVRDMIGTSRADTFRTPSFREALEHPAGARAGVPATPP